MWGEFEILEEDLAGFKFLADGIKPDEQEWSATWTRISTQSAFVQDASHHSHACDWLVTEEDEGQDHDKWESWFRSQHAPVGNENYLSIVISGPAYFPNLGKSATWQAALNYVGLPEDEFRDILGRIKIHPSFLGVVKDSGPVATRHEYQVDGRKCVVYLLRVSNSTSGQSAMAITYFPGTRPPHMQETGSRINVLILGYDQKDISLFKNALSQRRRIIFAPRAVIMAFLEVEKQKRFREVRLRRSGLKRILHRTSSTEEIATAVAHCQDRHRNVDDNVGLYLNVSDLVVDALQPWKQHVLSLESQVNFEDPQLALDLRQLALQYEHRISRCDKILQGASLAYQMETTYLSRNDASTAINDGKRMKAISLLTMIFLPATFTATLMAVPQIERAIDARNAFGDAGWLWYLVLSLSFTGLVLALYLTWGCTSFLRRARKEPICGDDAV